MAVANQELFHEASQAAGTGFSVIFVVCFAVFLLVALAAQVTGLRWRGWFPGAEGESSMLGAVKAAVYSVMSHLT